ncbi:lipid droplet-associated hydrolase-like [Dreissena polymorpha]|uniref:Lipid droplet-associated hydrolase n=1 Tax=Dreissena polymorpha TaxID=45954 RepID=A0A9D4DAJ2_DREPO|nr:lipid droplet-associated hydrolase-like [Dreissena polymorpha]XP_052239913.1 lipid droplet-associated hydrolase-like [Dreissena polymorpha]XP_052239914.1 lipid droplet-associated hydrolase-like [Dreissena polymorpha]KAH3740223.1 hypothetical protein DPMN_046922 [Dreissena polymorpha]
MSARGVQRFLPVLGMPTSVLQIGTVTKETKHAFLVIPGNPGVIEFYKSFMEKLYDNYQGTIPVLGVSHAGHVKPPDGNQALYNKLSYELCTLSGQIRHKIAFIDENIPKSVKLILIGHSIGCYIILKILDQLEHSVLRCFLLFPTIERMASSPNGKVYTPALKYLRWLARWMVLAISLLPERTKAWLINFHFSGEEVPPCAMSATLSFIQPFSVSNSLFMANEEMQAVDQLDTRLVEKNLNLLSFYFGSTDRWCPLQYASELKALFPTGDIRMCERGYSHAYLIDASPQMADIVYEWVKPYLTNLCS